MSDEFQQLLLKSLLFQTKSLSLDWQRLQDVSAQIPALKRLIYRPSDVNAR